MTPCDGHTFFTSLKYKTEDQGKREIISFMIPPGASRPYMKMTDPVTLEVTVPGVLALPATELKLKESKWIGSFKMAEVPYGEEMGIQLTFGLKSPNVNFRDSLGESDPIDGALYRLELDAPIIPSGAGPAQLLDGRVLAGRDGTLVLINHTGNGHLEPVLDLSAHIVHLNWQGAVLNPTWQTMAPAGLATKINAQAFKGKVEMEIQLHDSVSAVSFHHDPTAGMFIASLRSKDGLGRHEEALKLLGHRRQTIAEKQPLPLHRIGRTLYVNDTENKVVLNGQSIDELYYLNNAKAAEQDHRFSKARGYIDSLLEVFPLTKNREFLEFYKLDLAHHMDWKSGWMLSELNTLMARYPNTADYSRLRLMQLQLLNQSSQFQEASAILWDPNLPTDHHLVWLERGRTAMGLINSKISPDENLKAGEMALLKVLEYTRNQGSTAAEARYLLIQLAKAFGDHEKAVKMLDELSPEQQGHIANSPERIMEAADIYYKFRRYGDAVKYYVKLLSHYPTHPTITPWAMLRAAECNRQLGYVDDAIRLFDRLKKDHPTSDATVWGRIFHLQLEKDQDIQNRLDELDQILTDMTLPKEQAETFKSSIKMLLVESNRHWDVKKSLNQLAAMKKDYPKIDNKIWERIPMLQESMEQNFKDRMTRLNKIIQEIALPEALAVAYMTKAEMLGEAGRYKEGLEVLNDLLTISSRDTMVARAKEIKRNYLTDGMSQALDEGRPEYAAILGEVYGEDWREDPAFVPARIHLAEAMLRMGLNEEALRLLNGIHTDTATALTQLAKTISGGSILDQPPKETNKTLPPSKGITPDVARVRLDEARRMVQKQDWEAVLLLLDGVSETIFNPTDRIERWRLLAKAEAGLERFPQAVQHMEDLLFSRPMGDGIDYYWYASILHKWKGDSKALPAFQRVVAEAQNKEIQALARIRVGDILQRSGDLKAAKEQFSGVGALAPATPWSKVSKENASQLGMALDVNP
ncbi:MAG: tetratricopeptide repeat protein [Magnetococcales bacterium]|nr:tetratricopeptide repeat protein [Magnetococcales bacterium]